jgi:hypothetical protein
MNSEEQTLIDGLFGKLKQAETDSAPRDAQAEALIKEHLTRQPAAPYYMAQAILVQEVAVKQLEAQSRQRDEQIQQLQAELQRAQGAAGAGAEQRRIPVEHLRRRLPRAAGPTTSIVVLAPIQPAAFGGRLA